jgi:hypothetical protein
LAKSKEEKRGEKGETSNPLTKVREKTKKELIFLPWGGILASKKFDSNGSTSDRINREGNRPR